MVPQTAPHKSHNAQGTKQGLYKPIRINTNYCMTSPRHLEDVSKEEGAGGLLLVELHLSPLDGRWPLHRCNSDRNCETLLQDIRLSKIQIYFT